MALAQSIVLRTSKTPLRHLWALAYALLARAFALWLRGAHRDVTVYVRGGLGAGDITYGLSDIDLAVVVPKELSAPGNARERVDARYQSLVRLLPWLGTTILDTPIVLERDELSRLRDPPVYFGPHVHRHRISVHDRPGLRGPTTSWQRLSGPQLALPQPLQDRAQLRVVAWLELQALWRWFLQACGRPPTADLSLLCVKMVAEPARIWLALVHGEYPTSRRQVLTRVRALLPGEERAIARALWLEGALVRRPPAPLAEFLPYLVRFSRLITTELIDEVAKTGATRVRLDWRRDESLALDMGEPAALPLVDWRALTRAGLRWRDLVLSEPPDESFVLGGGDPGELGDVVRAAQAGTRGTYHALRAEDLILLPSQRWPRTQLRAVHCPLTDPVSFALIAELPDALYPNVRGWSAGDAAARAVSEHRAWMAHPDVLGAGGEALGMLISAARAALFDESIAHGAPRLPLTVAATLRTLPAYLPGRAPGLDEVEGAYLRWRRDGVVPGETVVAAARDVVRRLRAYAGAR